MDAATIQTQLAGSLIESILGQSQQAQTDLAMKLARVSLSMQMQSPPGTADASGAGGSIDMVA
jgi:hypothetical protein